MVRVEHLGRHHHGDCEVGTQLVVGPRLAGVVRVLVNTASVDELGTQLVLWSWRPVDPELALKVVCNFVFPLRERPSCVASCKDKLIQSSVVNKRVNFTVVISAFD